MVNGYAVINKDWTKGDVVAIKLPLEVRRVIAIDSIAADRNKVSLQRGPLMYCFEHPDNEGKVANIVVPDNIVFNTTFKEDKLGGVMELESTAPAIIVTDDGLSVNTKNQKVIAIPYYSWANRGQGQMLMWMPRKISAIDIVPKK